jgi:hypothetical protein
VVCSSYRKMHFADPRSPHDSWINKSREVVG